MKITETPTGRLLCDNCGEVKATISIYITGKHMDLCDACREELRAALEIKKG